MYAYTSFYCTSEIMMIMMLQNANNTLRGCGKCSNHTFSCLLNSLNMYDAH